MRYTKLKNTDLKVSVVGLGTWVMGNDFWGGSVDDNESIRAIHASIDKGINLIDTAPAYVGGHSEKVVGKAIKGKRDKVILATKVGVKPVTYEKDLSPSAIRREIEDSLTSLGVDCIDIYQIHWPDPETALEDTLNELIKLKDEGKFRYLGVSNFPIKMMQQVMEVTPLVTTQPQYSILHREPDEKYLPFCLKNNINVFTYASLGGGALTGKYTQFPELDEHDLRPMFYTWFTKEEWPKVQHIIETLRKIANDNKVAVSHVAINWVLAQKGVTTTLVGARNRKQAESNAAAGDFIISDKDLAAIDKSYTEVFK